MKHREKAMAALLSSDTQTEAAKKIGVTPRTLRGYLADPEFSDEYKQRKRQLISDATRQLQRSYRDAIEALHTIVTNEKSSEAGRISAARALLEYGNRFTEVNEVMTTLEELEHIAENRQKG